MEEIIYHYTSLEVLKKILENGKLRFSKMDSLNDRTEYRHGIELLKNKIIEFESNNNIHKGFDVNLLDRFSFPNNLYSISFTQNGDDLTFWNSYYVPQNTPVCIGFLKKRIFDNNFIVNRCIYGDPYPPMTEERYLWFTEIFKIQNILRLHKNREYIHITFQTAHLKNKAFEIERELRAVSFGISTSEFGTFIRNGKRIEYFDQKFFTESISEIIIGPSNVQENNYQQAEVMIKEKKINCELRKSNIPLLFS